jgi:tetrahydromethanopterin S-methyltransferase subunit H
MFEQIQEQVNELVENALFDCHKMVNGQRTGIDERALYNCWYNDHEVIVLTRNAKALDYYGGFEYVDPEYRMVIGNYTVYNSGASRVEDLLLMLNDINGKATQLINCFDIELGNGIEEADIKALQDADAAGEQVIVICEATDNYYDVQLQDGTVIQALSGLYLQCLNED